MDDLIIANYKLYMLYIESSFLNTVVNIFSGLKDVEHDKYLNLFDFLIINKCKDYGTGINNIIIDYRNIFIQEKNKISRHLVISKVLKMNISLLSNTIASKINISTKGVRLSEKLQLAAALCNEI